MSDVPEDYPYASVEAEARIRRVTTAISVVTVGLLLAGLGLAFGTPRFGLGSLLTLLGFFGLIVVPFVGKSMRRSALAREAADGAARGQDAR